MTGEQVVVAEPLADIATKILTNAGYEVIALNTGSGRTDLVKACEFASALIVRSATTVDRELLESCPKLRVIGRAGVGVDNIDLAAATELGVIVANAPLANVTSAAEHTMAMILASARNVAQAHSSLAEGRWDRALFSGVELHGKTLGVVGMGRIGRAVAHRASSFGMAVLAHDPFLDSSSDLPAESRLVDMDELLSAADFITLHVAQTPETKNLVDASFLAKTKPGCRIINVARGGLVVEGDLLGAIESGHIAGAAIDVFRTEPVVDSPLFGHPSIVTTPHLGASTAEAQDRAAETIAQQVEIALSGHVPPHAINARAMIASETELPFLRLAHQLGTLIGQRTAPAPPDTISVKLSGELGREDGLAVVASCQRGVLSGVLGREVSVLEAEGQLDALGIATTVTRHENAGGATSTVALSTSTHSVTGTMLWDSGDNRVVEIDGYRVSMPLGRNFLMIRNDDKPGVVASVAGELARAGINISDMSVGAGLGNGPALMVLATARDVPEETLGEVALAAGLLSLEQVSLGPEHVSS